MGLGNMAHLSNPDGHYPVAFLIIVKESIMTTNKSVTTSAKSAMSRKYPALSTYLKRIGGLAGLGRTAQEMTWELFEAVRKEVTNPKFANRTVVSTTELSTEVKALVESVCSDKNHPYYIRRQIVRFFVSELRFPLTADGKWKSEDLIVKKVISVQKRLAKRVSGYNKVDKNDKDKVIRVAPWAEYPIVLQEVEKEKTEKEKTFKPAKDMIEKLIKQFQGENAEKIEGSSEYATLLSFVVQNQELINFVKDHFEEFEAKRVEATK